MLTAILVLAIALAIPVGYVILLARRIQRELREIRKDLDDVKAECAGARRGSWATGVAVLRERRD